MTPLDQRTAQLIAAGRSRNPEGRGLGEYALEKTALDPNALVVIQGDTRLTRSGMLDAACRLGGALIARGILPGAAIAFQLPNWWEACVINLTAALFGYRIVPLLTIYRTAELGTILPTCGVEALFTPQKLRNTDYPAMVASLPEPPQHLFVVRGDEVAPESFEQLLQHAPVEPILPDPDEAKLVLFTSGSTGRPKGVIHNHKSIDALIGFAAEFWSIGPEDTFYVPSPIGHVGGSIYAFEFPWISDCTVVLAETWDADLAVREIEEYGATFMAGATPFLSGLIEAAEAAGSSLPNLRRFVCGGASVPPELVQKGLERFPNAVVSRAYGSTEIPLVCPGVRTRIDAESHTMTDGEVAIDLQILGEDGQPVEAGEQGGIAARGARMFLGYLDPADEDGCFTPDGYFHMGDLGRLVDGRFLEITGRQKDIIIRKGENISPLEIENALARHDAVRQSAVVGVPDPKRGEMVVAFVLPEQGAEFTFQDMIAHLDALGLAKQKFPERLEVVETLPVNAVGKVQKVQLRDLATNMPA